MSFSSSSSTILLTCFLVSFLVSIVASSTPNTNKLIEQACSTSLLRSKSKQCVQILESQPKIVSANNYYDFTPETMKSGISSATNTSTRIEQLLRGGGAGPSSKEALLGCKDAQDNMARTFKHAYDVVVKTKVTPLFSPSYDLLIGSTDNFNLCLADVAAGKIKDPEVLRGNDATVIYGLTASDAVDYLSTH